MTALRPHWGSRQRTRNGVRVLGGGRSELPRPDLEDGQVRCPSCGNGVVTYRRNPRQLVQHRTLRGDRCGQRTIAVPVELDELPPVDLGPRVGLYPNGTCQTPGCGVPITGERIYCGMCMARRS